jgi:hypothetical protein
MIMETATAANAADFLEPNQGQALLQHSIPIFFSIEAEDPLFLYLNHLHDEL